MNVRRLLKVYNYVNDDRRARVNLKFAAALVAFLTVGVALVWFMTMDPRAGPDGGTDAVATKTEYVGAPLNVPLQGCPNVEAIWQAWLASHDNVVVDEREPVRSGSCLVGYQVTYHAA